MIAPWLLLFHYTYRWYYYISPFDISLIISIIIFFFSYYLYSHFRWRHYFHCHYIEISIIRYAIIILLSHDGCRDYYYYFHYFLFHCRQLLRHYFRLSFYFRYFSITIRYFHYDIFMPWLILMILLTYFAALRHLFRHAMMLFIAYALPYHAVDDDAYCRWYLLIIFFRFAFFHYYCRCRAGFASFIYFQRLLITDYFRWHFLLMMMPYLMPFIISLSYLLYYAIHWCYHSFRHAAATIILMMIAAAADDAAIATYFRQPCWCCHMICCW